MGLGFDQDDFNRSTTEFSGGWLMRIALAKLLLKQPTYLLLDEPTNHLDIESLRWIEQFLATYDGAVIIVSTIRHSWILLPNARWRWRGEPFTTMPEIIPSTRKRIGS